jgi:hypothetical protein
VQTIETRAPQNVGSVKSLGIFLKISNFLKKDADPDYDILFSIYLIYKTSI